MSGRRRSKGKSLSRSKHREARPFSLEEAKELFRKYPRSVDGKFMQSFKVKDKNAISAALACYGVVVVQLMSPERCDATVASMFQQMNGNQRKDIAKSELNLKDPSTWENDNWPSGKRFLTGDYAISKEAFHNRTDPRLHELFGHLYQTKELWASIDNWGVMRGTKDLRFSDSRVCDREDWKVKPLKIHWDINLCKYVEDIKAGKPRRYQGILALDDCPEEVGGFCCIPGSARVALDWLRRGNTPYNGKFLPESDIMMPFIQKFPLQKGQLVIWDCGQAHGNFANNSERMRLIQFLRLMPVGTHEDNRNPADILKKREDIVKKIEEMKLSPREKALFGLEQYKNVTWND